MKNDFTKILKGISFTVPLKIMFQVFNSLVNFILIRRVDPAVYGLTSITTLLSSLYIFLIDQILKKVYVRRIKTELSTSLTHLSHNIMMIGTGVSVVISFFMGHVFIYLYGNKHSYFNLSVYVLMLDCLSTCLYEVLSVGFVLDIDYYCITILNTMESVFRIMGLGYLLLYTECDTFLAFALAKVVSVSVKLFLMFLYHK